MKITLDNILLTVAITLVVIIIEIMMINLAFTRSPFKTLTKENHEKATSCVL